MTLAAAVIWQYWQFSCTAVHKKSVSIDMITYTKLYINIHTTKNCVCLCYYLFYVMTITENNFIMGVPKIYGFQVTNNLGMLLQESVRMCGEYGNGGDEEGELSQQ